MAGLVPSLHSRGVPVRRFVWMTALVLVGACGRSGLDAEWDEQWLDGGGPDGQVVKPLPDGALPDGGSSTCTPTEEVCNGVDDDCDGQVDEVPSIPCEGGGAQYCVAGAYSLCPDRCEVCIPGAERVCFNSYCKYWGQQTCAADGKGYGKCKENEPPPERKSIAKDKQYSKELEQCCVDNGYCCVDDFDLDEDGNSSEMIGQCEDVLCK